MNFFRTNELRKNVRLTWSSQPKLVSNPSQIKLNCMDEVSG